MGERKGQNHYYPPDFFTNLKKNKNLNNYHGTTALRERGTKMHIGIITIRFEMPYNIWCEGCKNHIGMGVRYNAEKSKLGMYYSTPVYKFRMKCHLCDNYFEIKTDPGNLDYEILSGASRQENRWDPLENEQIVPETKETQRKLFDDAMYKLEHGAKDIKTLEDAKPVLSKLYMRNDDVWRDNYESNYKLRAEFRKTKKELKLTEELDNKVLARTSLDIKLLPESEEDKQMASLLQLHAAKSIIEKTRERRLEVINKPALPSSTITSFGGMKREKLLSQKLKLDNLVTVKKRESTQGSSKQSTEAVKKKKSNNVPIASLVSAYSSSSDEDDNT
ncbi:unnamed protein product [Diamesa serratosioi]